MAIRMHPAFVTVALSLRTCLSPLAFPRSSFAERLPFTCVRPNSRPFSMVVSASKSNPGVLDTDDAGGVLMASREGSIDISFGPALSAYAGELLVIGLWAPEDDDESFVFPDFLKAFEGNFADGVLTEIVADAEFKAKAGSSTEIVRIMGSGPKRVVLYGLGKKSKGVSSVSGAAKFAMQKGMGIKSCTSVGIYLHDPCAKCVTEMAEGATVGGYVDERYKEKKDSEKVPTELVLVGVKTEPKYEKAVSRGRALATGIITTKEVINAPANALTPATLALASETVAKECGLDIKVLGRAECEELGMGSYLGVGRGSTDEPKFIHMTYKPEGEVKKKICIVGKAVTFDTGGTNLKVGASMIELMKFDMGGSAVALGAAKVLGALKPKGVEVHFIMPAVENMIGDRAIHPGDILKASNGKTIEVINTDAEGRLCLADALVYAENLGDVDYVVDIATLTGAIIVALGNDVAGMWCSSDEMADALLGSSKAVGENLWRMPLVDEYVEGLKSKIADLRNIGVGRGAGSITAALFLREFVKTKNWAHLDIAGTVWADKKGGATGYGVKTMVHWVESLAE